MTVRWPQQPEGFDQVRWVRHTVTTSQQPPQPQPDPHQPGRGPGLPRRLPPGERPVSPELIADLHARREWLAESKVAGRARLYEYLRYEWYDREARQWAEADISAGAALVWRELGLRPCEAAGLQDEGFVPEQVSALWRGSGIPLDEVADWIGAGLTPQEALSQRAQGVTAQDAAVMRRLRNLGAT